MFNPNTTSKKEAIMGYKVKIQRVDRKTTSSYYVNFPLAVAEAAGIEKGEEFEWIIEDCNTMVFRRLDTRDKPFTAKIESQRDE